MIRHLIGQVIEIDEKSIILDVGGVGYHIYITPETQRILKNKKDKIGIYTYLAVREDALNLYGFLNKPELNLFELLISVSGIGPKGALAILTLAPANTIRQSIASGNIEHLTKMSGIGRKRAEKIILELKDKIIADAEASDTSLEALKQESETLEALKAMGYSLAESRDAMQGLSPELATKDRLREALKRLGKKI